MLTAIVKVDVCVRYKSMLVTDVDDERLFFCHQKSVIINIVTKYHRSSVPVPNIDPPGVFTVF